MDNKSFSDLITFTRATTGTWLNPATGLIEIAAANAPRLEAKGLLFEQQRTNLALRSSEFSNAAWAKIGVSIVSSESVLAPDGTFASKMTESTANSVHTMTQAGKALVGATYYCRSVYARSDGSGRLLRLASDFTAAWEGAYSFVDFDLGTGLASATTAAVGTYGIEPVGGGWFRCWMCKQASAAPGTVSITTHLISTSGASYQGDGVSGIYIWGWQFEAGESPSSLIPTVAATVTRAADLAYAPVSSWFKTGSGTLMIEASHDVVGALISASLGTSAADPRVSLQIAPGVISRAIITSNGGATVFAMDIAGDRPPGMLVKQAIAYNQAGWQASAAGQVSAVGNSVEIPSIDRLTLGARGTSVAHMQGHIKKILYFPRRLTSAELQALT